jgi:hypothetical protein
MTIAAQPAMQDYHKLEIWQRAMNYAVTLHKFTSQLPDTERYNLTAQMRKAATSVCLNTAEGAGCSTDGEFARIEEADQISRMTYALIQCLDGTDEV